jgi:hypothetical protein
MSTYRKGRNAPTAREPVQVYLNGLDRERLERLTSRLDATKSDVLRRGLWALEQQLSDPGAHPALRIVGIVDLSGAGAGDAAREHDRVLAEGEESGWSGHDVG